MLPVPQRVSEGVRIETGSPGPGPHVTTTLSLELPVACRDV